MSLVNVFFKQKWPLWAWLALALLVLGLLALLASLFGTNPNDIHEQAALVAPLKDLAFPLGTDDLGRDLLSRLAVGTQLSLWLGCITAFVAVGFGGFYGLLCALAPASVNQALTRLMDALASLPGLMIVLLLAVFFKPYFQQMLGYLGLASVQGLAAFVSLVLALALFSWPDTARIIRTQTQSLLQEPYIEAYTSMGGGLWRLIFKQLLPNLLPYFLLSLTLTVPRAVLTESTLSFIGLGVEPPLSSLGTLASDGWYLVRVAPYTLILPSVLLIACMALLYQLGQSLEKDLR
jgi:oligopeptide transport system permease protein